jgi:hypothetical protein
MNKSLVGLVLIALLIGLGGGYVLGYVIYQPKLQSLQNDVNNMGDEMDNLSNDLDTLGNRLDRFNSTLRDTQSSNIDIERFLHEISRVELLRNSSGDGASYQYYYGVSGHWNITKLQTEPLKDKLNSTISGALMWCAGYENSYYSLEPEGKGYTELINMGISRELSPTEIEEVRLLIETYLAHL